MKVLIVDDNKADRKIMRLNFERHGYEVIEAEDGRDGLEKAGAHKPDLIISDAMMPNMDGFQFLMALKKDESLRGIPFIFHSAVYTGERETELALSLGAEAFIVKPKEPFEFWEDIKKILEAFESRNARAAKTELIPEEEVFLREYSQIVFSKLGEKIRELEAEISRRRQAEETLAEEEAFYRAILEDLPDLICRWLPDGTLTYVNENYCRYFGMTKEELVGKSFYPLIPEEDHHEVKRHAASISRKKPVAKTEHRVIISTGEIRWNLWTDRALFDEAGNIREFQSMGMDITERKQMEETLKERMEELEKFYEMAVGRELKMKELKEKIAALEAELSKYQASKPA